MVVYRQCALHIIEQNMKRVNGATMQKIANALGEQSLSGAHTGVIIKILAVMGDDLGALNNCEHGNSSMILLEYTGTDAGASRFYFNEL
jgi:hypothetical protein